jgi:hypothetical protein
LFWPFDSLGPPFLSQISQEETWAHLTMSWF